MINSPTVPRIRYLICLCG